MTKDFEIQMVFEIKFDDEGLDFKIKITEPEDIACEGKFQSFIDSIGGIKVWEKETARIAQIHKRKDIYKVINLICKDQEFIDKKQSKQFNVLFKNTETDKEVDEILDEFFEYIVENLNETITLH